MIVLGFTGTFAAGKDTAIAIIAAKFGAKAMQISTSDICREETAKHGLPITRDNIFKVANETRFKYGAGVFGRLAAERIKKHVLSTGIFLVSGIRNPGEVEELAKAFGKDFHLIAVDAPLEVRYQRVKERSREGEGVLSFEDFKKSQEKEMNGEAHSQNIASVMKMADFTVQNNSDLRKFEEKIEGILKKVMK